MRYIRPQLFRAASSIYRPTQSYGPTIARQASTVLLVESRPSVYDPSYSSCSGITHRQPEIVTVTRPVSRSTVDTTSYYTSPPTNHISDIEWTCKRNETAQTVHGTLEQEKLRLPQWQQAVVYKGEKLEAARRTWVQGYAHLKDVNETYNASLGFTPDGLGYSGASYRPPRTGGLMDNREAARANNRKARRDYEDLKIRIDSMRYDKGLIELGRQIEDARYKWDRTHKNCTSALHKAGREVKLVRASGRYSEAPYQQAPQQSTYSYWR